MPCFLEFNVFRKATHLYLFSVLILSRLEVTCLGPTQIQHLHQHTKTPYLSAIWFCNNNIASYGLLLYLHIGGQDWCPHDLQYWYVTVNCLQVRIQPTWLLFDWHIQPNCARIWCVTKQAAYGRSIGNNWFVGPQYCMCCIQRGMSWL